MSGYQAVYDALEQGGYIVQSWSDTIAARCPAHDDTKASLSLKEGDDGKALLFCHAGCDTRDVAEALDLTMSDLFSAGHGGLLATTYPYTDEAGELLYRVLRYSPKGFSQQRYVKGEWVNGMGDVRRVLYQLPELLAAGADTPVYVCEGEKDADALRRLGLVATTLLGGANKWRDEYTPFFAGRDVVLCGDNDDPGRAHVDMLRDRLAGVAASITSLFPAVGKDVSDHLNAGLDIGDMVMESDGLDEFMPLDWETYEGEDTEWLLEPYLPAGARVLAFGPAASLKSLWAMWAAARLSREGKKVAYFSLEMLPSATAKRLKQLAPDKQNFLCFTSNFRLGSPSHTEKLISALRGYDLIVVDSWTAARSHAGRESNEAVAELDNEVLLPLIKQTGATVLLIDNTGHDFVTDSGKIRADHARGASAKGDKMEVTLWFHRPFEDNNYRTTINVKKMRLDYPIPAPLTVETPSERIEFYTVEQGIRTEKVAWGGGMVTEEKTANPEEMTPEERRKLARIRDMFKVVSDEPVQEVPGSVAGEVG